MFFRKALSLLLLLFSLMWVALPRVSKAENGGDRGGGDATEEEFFNLATAGVEILAHRLESAPGVDIERVRQDLRRVKVETTTSDLFIADGTIKTALNYPSEARIMINVGRWSKIVDQRRKTALALHEILGISGYERNHYRLTAAVFAMHPDAIEKGRFAFLGRGANYHRLSDVSPRPKWLHVEVDAALNRLYFVFWDKEVLFVTCNNDGQACKGEYTSKGDDVHKKYEVEILPDGNLIVFSRAYSRNFFGEWNRSPDRSDKDMWVRLL